MKRAVVMAEGTHDRRRRSRTGAGGARRRCRLDLRAARLRAEREVLQLALARSNGTLSAAAKLLGVSRPTLYGLMEVHGIEIEPGQVADRAARDRRTPPGWIWSEVTQHAQADISAGSC